jgi:hypothetical protein
MSENAFTIFRGNLMTGKTGLMDRSPETVPAPREVAAQHRRPEPGIDAAEHNAQIRRQDIL